MVENSPNKKDKTPADTDWTLQITLQDGVKTIALENTEYCIGRSDEADINIDDKMASRKHARLYFEKGFWRIQDLGSSNGLYVENRKVEKAKMAAGVKFKIGGTLFTLLDKKNSSSIKSNGKEKKYSEKSSFRMVLLGAVLLLGITLTLFVKKNQNGHLIQAVNPPGGVEKLSVSQPVTETRKTTAESITNTSSSIRRIENNKEEEENKIKAKEFFRTGLLFYDNGNLKKAIDQWDLALSYDKSNPLVVNKLAKAIEELDYLISVHYKDGKMNMKYSRFYQAEQDLMIVKELARDKGDARYLDALEQLERIKKK